MLSNTNRASSGDPVVRRPRPTLPLATCGRRSIAGSSPVHGLRCRPPYSRPHPWPGDWPPSPCTRAAPTDRPPGPFTARCLPLPLPPPPGPFVPPDPDPPLVPSITEVSKMILVIPSQISCAHACLYLLLANKLSECW